MGTLFQVLKLAASYHFSPAVLPVIWTRVRTGSLPHTRQANRALWGWWDWSSHGDEWSNSSVPGWKDGLVEHLLIPFIGEGQRILEIGPGAGRWTEHIIPKAEKTILVDLTPECIALCRNRFGDNSNVEFHVNDGRTLSAVKSASITRVWSLDVFVHIHAQDIESYVREIGRVMAPGAKALIHHSRTGERRANWRSDMTALQMVKFVEQSGLEIIDQFDSWGRGDLRLWPTVSPDQNPDVITTFRNPA